MKKGIWMLALATLIVSTPFAQENGNKKKALPKEKKAPEKMKEAEKLEGEKAKTPEERAKKQVDRMDKIAQLSADQKTKMHDLALKHAQDMKALRAKHAQSEDKEKAKSEFHAAHKNYKEAVKNILTVEQQEKVKQHREAKKKEHQKHHANKQPKTAEERAQQATDRLDKIVGLTSDQKAKIHTLAMNRAHKMDELRIKHKESADKEAMKNDFKEANKNYRLAVKEILTKEQMEKLKKHAQSKKKNPSAEDLIPVEE